MLSDDAAVRQQYQNADRLNTRISIHDRYSVNKTGFGNWIFSNYRLAPGMRVLELGCGTANMWRGKEELIRLCGEIMLSDLSEGMLEEAKQNVGTHENVSFAAVDVQAIPYPSQSFDAVIANMMLYHVPDLEKALSQVRRVLKAGGRFYCATYGEHGIQEFLSDALAACGVENRLNRAFTLQNGEGILKRHFSNVERLDYRDSLAVTDVNDMVDYVCSLTGMTALKQVPRAEIRAALQRRMRDGVLHVPKEYGMFIAS